MHGLKEIWLSLTRKRKYCTYPLLEKPVWAHDLSLFGWENKYTFYVVKSINKSFGPYVVGIDFILVKMEPSWKLCIASQFLKVNRPIFQVLYLNGGIFTTIKNANKNLSLN